MEKSLEEIEWFTITSFLYMWLSSCLLPFLPRVQPTPKRSTQDCVCPGGVCLKPPDRQLVMFEENPFLMASSVVGSLGAVSIFKEARFLRKPDFQANLYWVLNQMTSNQTKSNKHLLGAYARHNANLIPCSQGSQNLISRQISRKKHAVKCDNV